MINAMIIVAAVGSNSDFHRATEETTADVIEVNSVVVDFSQQDKPTFFNQWIIWSVQSDGRLHVRDWAPCSGEGITLRLRANGCELVRIKDGRRWIVKAKEYREVTSLKDREVLDRKHVPISHRTRIWSDWHER